MPLHALVMRREPKSNRRRRAEVRAPRPGVVVRRALPSDAADVTTLRLALLREEGKSPLFSQPHPDVETRARRLTAIQLNAAASREVTFLAEAGEGKVGMLRCAIVPGPVLVRDSQYAVLTTAYVVPLWRRHGVLSALVRAAESWCQSHGVPEMRLHCTVENVGADAAWRSLGFHPAQVVHRRVIPHQ